MNKFILTIVFALATISLKAQHFLNVSFYNSDYLIEYDSSMYFDYKYIAWDHFFKDYYKKMDRAKHQVILSNLLQLKEELNLNDWYYYKLIRATAKAFYKGKKERNATFLTWFLLNKSNFNARISFYRRKVFVDVYTKQDLVNVPRQALQNQDYFVDLSSYFNHYNYDKLSFYQVLFYPTYDGDNFDFSLDKVPTFFNKTKTLKEINYIVDDKAINFDIEFSKSYVKDLKSYPEINYHLLSEMAISDALANSLDRHFNSVLNGLNTEQKVRYLLSFVRTAFKYKSDKKVHKHYNKAVGIEAIFGAKYIDDEEYAILFKFLVERYVQIDAIIVDFPLRAAAAVLLPKPIGKPVEYHEKKYSYCQTNDKSDALNIGEYTATYDVRPYKIIEE